MVRIITDTTAGLPVEVARRYDIPIMPQIVVFDRDSYLEGIDLDNAGFMRLLTTSSELPKTSAPPPEMFVEQFRRLVPAEEAILCLHPSSEISGTVRSAQVAAQEFPDADIRVIDTRTIASPLAAMVQLAAEWAAAGEDVDTIEGRLRALIPRCRIYFLVATLEFLARGGRIGGAAALLGGVLQLKPILTLRDGRVDQFARVRTHSRAVAYLKDLALQQVPRDGSAYLAVIHAGVPDQAQSLADDLRAPLGVATIDILDVPPAIVTHAGPGVLGIGFFAGQAV